ncbi:Dehydrogenase multihelical [Penicillium lagena]|uniref:Dehydrogenase multihelical n=1 Tax=Penicillium lagena TaxID=94218 RepID=UPI0025400187|nr:Dehydrogenase multihelical [Penicillium lagena]KAJ5602011.1 Dehydrogenase multihelical [Penicillium lagena]
MRPTTVGILSIGDMGLGIAKLLKAHGYRVVTVGTGRSENTLARIRLAAIETLPSDQELVVQADYIFSIVPPRDALATGQRIAEACRLPDTGALRAAVEDSGPLYFLELNATSPRLVEEIAALFRDESATSVQCHCLDGGIIGGPPAQKNSPDGPWTKPSVVLSGAATESLPPTFASLADVVNMKIVSPRIGGASTLKLSFASLTKGLTALSILSFSTAQQADCLPELLDHLDQYSPRTAALARNGVIGMSPKAYRWVDEMSGIGEAFDTNGHWGGTGARVYGAFAEIYRAIAEETVLGEERVEHRTRGTTVEDAAQIIARMLEPRMS